MLRYGYLRICSGRIGLPGSSRISEENIHLKHKGRRLESALCQKNPKCSSLPTMQPLPINAGLYVHVSYGDGGTVVR